MDVRYIPIFSQELNISRELRGCKRKNNYVFVRSTKERGGPKASFWETSVQSPLEVREGYRWMARGKVWVLSGRGIQHGSASLTTRAIFEGHPAPPKSEKQQHL